jgi:hypothetical protein
MAEVVQYEAMYIALLNGVELGRFINLLDAHCFAMQLLERGLAQSVRLYSGITVT